MSKLKFGSKTPIGCTIFFMALWLYIVIAWIVNFVKLLYCDFEAPYKDEIVHLVGLIPGCSAITCWF